MIATLILAAACGDAGSGATSGSASGAKSGAPQTSAKPGASASAKTSSTPAASATAETPALSASALASASAAPAASGAPATGGAEFSADVKRLMGLVASPVDLEYTTLAGFLFKAPKGAALTPAPAPGEWSEITADGATMAFFAQSPSDGGEGCPKLADMKGKAKDAKTLVEINEKQKPWGKESYGDEVSFWLYEKDGKAGFYGTKVFKGPKEATTYCFAAGKASEAAGLKGLLAKDKAELLAGVALGLYNKL